MLIEPKFSLFNLRSGYVGLCDIDIPCSIPPSDVPNYKYSPVPLLPLPPMPTEVFLHYLEHGDIDNIHNRKCWLERLPIRLKSRIVDAREEPVWGWGIHIIEGPNRTVIFWITMVTIFGSMLAFVLWSSLRSDISGGAAMGSLIMALPPVIMTAFLFKLAAV
jgi:hypothetical protein